MQGRWKLACVALVVASALLGDLGLGAGAASTGARTRAGGALLAQQVCPDAEPCPPDAAAVDPNGGSVTVTDPGQDPTTAPTPAKGTAAMGAGRGLAEEPAGDFVVLYGKNASVLEARAVIVAAGGTLRHENLAIGLATVSAADPAFPLAVLERGRVDGIVVGAGRHRIIGAAVPTPVPAPAPAPTDPAPADPALAEPEPSTDLAVIAPEPPARPDGWPDVTTPTDAMPVVPTVPRQPGSRATPDRWADEPLASQQWNLAAIGIPTVRDPQSDSGPSPASNQVMGRPSVTVGVIDTGIDAHHLDLADRVDLARSRNFTRDIPLIDGPCEEEADASCADGVDVDEDGHGTHVAGVIAASVNGFGMAGVAPQVTLINLRAGQDSGFFFLAAVVEALTYAGDIGIDVVNLSFFVDPWLFNCAANPADSPAEQLEQATTIVAMQRAVDYARANGVTVVAALGNEHTDLARPEFDTRSPNVPPGESRTRAIDNSCLDVPGELDGVISVSAVGPSLRKADYSNYGLEQTDLSAPGGWRRDGFGTPSYRSVSNQILSSWPTALARAELSASGANLPADLVEHCNDAGQCAFYKYLQGTSMAAPHVSGVAALIVSRFGRLDRARPDVVGFTLEPAVVEAILNSTARDHPCPAEGALSYADEERPAEYFARCEGTETRNGFYGEGIVDASVVISMGVVTS